MTKTRKRTTPARPAEPIAKHEPLAQIERDARRYYHIKKVIVHDGPEAAIEALAGLTKIDPDDPSNASMRATASVSMIGGQLDWGDSFRGRKAGARAPETVYLERLVEKYPYEDARGLWAALRAIVTNPGDDKNPTPGECPFTHRWAGVKPEVLKRGKPYPFTTFSNAISRIRKGLAAGDHT